MQTGSKQRRESKKAKRRAALPTRFTPRYLDDVDCRTSAIKEFKRRLLELQEAAGADSPQKKLLCERANFIASRLQSMELDALEGRDIDMGVYTQASNALMGILKTLKLDAAKAGKVLDLDAYVAGKTKAKSR